LTRMSSTSLSLLEAWIAARCRSSRTSSTSSSPGTVVVG
jgi:hypothetical protein